MTLRIPSGIATAVIDAIGAIAIAVFITVAFIAPGQAWAATSVERAVLYSLDDGTLVYNAFHETAVADDVVVDGELDGLDSLAKALGIPDTTPANFSLHVGERTLGKLVVADLEFDGDDSGDAGDDGDEGDVITRIMVTSVADRPVVGISWQSNTISASYEHIAKVLERNGALAVFLPQLTSDPQAEEVLAHVDGIMTTGGTDIDPGLYGETQDAHGSNKWNLNRTVSDFVLTRTALEEDVPMLAICRGMQIMNVLQGGKLIQDVPLYLGKQVLSGKADLSRVATNLSGASTGWKVLSGPSASDRATLVDVHGEQAVSQLESLIKQQNGSDAASMKDTGYDLYDEDGTLVGSTYDASTDEYESGELGSACEKGHLRLFLDGVIHGREKHVHAINKVSDSTGILDDAKWLHDIVGNDSIAAVASAHHQAPDPEHVGEGLTVAARSSDGIIEALEYRSNTFALGIQWHPECEALNDTEDSALIDADGCNKFFQALVYHASDYASDREESGARHHGAKTVVAKATSSRSGSKETVCTQCGATLHTERIPYIKTVSLKYTSFTYDGTAKTPSVIAEDSAGHAIAKRFYTVSYSGSHLNVGKFTATIKFSGEYSCTKTRTFYIKPKGTELTKLTSGRKYVKAYWGKQSAKMSLSRISGYRVQLSTSKSFSSGVKSYYVKGYSSTYKKVSKLKAKRRYYVRVQTYKYTSGVKRYSAWSPVMSVITK